MTATATTLAGARRLYVVAGLSAFLAMLANVAAGFSSLTLFTMRAPHLFRRDTWSCFTCPAAPAVCLRWRGSP